MALLALILVTGVGGVAAMAAGRIRRGAGATVGVIAALVVLGVAVAMPAEDSIGIGRSGLLLTELLRTIVVVWSVSIAVLALLELGAGASTVTGPGLLALAIAVTALSATDPFTAFAALAAGGLIGIVVPGAAAGPEGTTPGVKLATLARGSFAVLGASLLAVAVAAWGASPVGPFAGTAPTAGTEAVRVALGLALLAMVTAVGLRAGLIPLHVWAARFMEGATPLAVPAAFAWGTTAFILVALDWTQVTIGPTGVTSGIERPIIVIAALVSIGFGGLAALIHDDVEHVLGYSILQDAGVAVLAFVSLDTAGVAAARTWLVASAATKTALAAWASVVRTTYGEHRLGELRGWARRAPVLGAAFALIWVAAVGLPGTPLFDSRNALVFGAVPGLLGLTILIVALTPLGYLGRVAVAGLAAPRGAVAAVHPSVLRLNGQLTGGWSRPSPGQLVRAVPAGVRESRLPLMAAGVLVLATIGAALSLVGGTR